jgi:hypothetical protein
MFKRVLCTVLAILILALTLFNRDLGFHLKTIESGLLLLVSLGLFYFARK